LSTLIGGKIVQYGRDRRVISVIVRKRPRNYLITGFGPNNRLIFTDRGDTVIIESGTRTKITGAIQETKVTPSIDRLFVDVEIVPQTGQKILRVTGG